MTDVTNTQNHDNSTVIVPKAIKPVVYVKNNVMYYPDELHNRSTVENSILKDSTDVERNDSDSSQKQSTESQHSSSEVTAMSKEKDNADIVTHLSDSSIDDIVNPHTNNMNNGISSDSINNQTDVNQAGNIANNLENNAADDASTSHSTGVLNQNYNIKSNVPKHYLSHCIYRGMLYFHLFRLRQELYKYYSVPISLLSKQPYSHLNKNQFRHTDSTENVNKNLNEISSNNNAVNSTNSEKSEVDLKGKSPINIRLNRKNYVELNGVISAIKSSSTWLSIHFTTQIIGILRHYAFNVVNSVLSSPLSTMFTLFSTSSTGYDDNTGSYLLSPTLGTSLDNSIKSVEFDSILKDIDDLESSDNVITGIRKIIIISRMRTSYRCFIPKI